MSEQDAVLRFYAEPAPMSAPGNHRAEVDALPDDPAALVRALQGLLIYDVVAADFYGVELSDRQRSDIHIRRFEQLLDRADADEKLPLDQARPDGERVAGRCRDYTLMATSLLRAKGVPARARCGFASYLNPGHFEDHQVCEYWDDAAGGWKLLDAQLDDVWKEKLSLELDPFDVPRDRFLVAADAWARCRRDPDEAANFGISFGGLHGLWFVAGSLVRDAAALNKMEMLPWDEWGAQPPPDARWGADRLDYFDGVADLTVDPDPSFAELRRRYEQDDGLRVPGTVRNGLLEQAESV